MANPKRRLSKTVKRTRRAQWNNKLSLPAINKCNNCGESKISHHVCPACGFYDNRLVINTQNA